MNEDYSALIKGKTVLVTGGTGSFGRNFIRHLLEKYNPEKMIIFSRDELKQFEMQKKFQDSRIRFFIGDIRDKNRLLRAFQDVDIVVHAAALKQVPALEYNPHEAVETNINGTRNVIDAAIDSGVQKVLLISTDKAAQPVNLYGATKLCAEKLCIASNAYSKDTRFSVVRYGNVVGSRGSIVEILLKSKDLKEVSVTDPQMTRFWITLPQSFELVLFTLANMRGGELVVPKVPSMSVVDVITICAPNARQCVTGIRPGEKIHEILLTSQEARRAYDIGKYFVALPEFQFFEGGYDHWSEAGTTLDPYFEYTSDKNTDIFEKETFRKIAERTLKSYLI